MNPLSGAPQYALHSEHICRQRLTCDPSAFRIVNDSIQFSEKVAGIVDSLALVEGPFAVKIAGWQASRHGQNRLHELERECDPPQPRRRCDHEQLFHPLTERRGCAEATKHLRGESDVFGGVGRTVFNHDIGRGNPRMCGCKLSLPRVGLGHSEIRRAGADASRENDFPRATRGVQFPAERSERDVEHAKTDDRIRFRGWQRISRGKVNQR